MWPTVRSPRPILERRRAERTTNYPISRERIRALFAHNWLLLMDSDLIESEKFPWTFVSSRVLQQANSQFSDICEMTRIWSMDEISSRKAEWTYLTRYTLSKGNTLFEKGQHRFVRTVNIYLLYLVNRQSRGLLFLNVQWMHNTNIKYLVGGEAL